MKKIFIRVDIFKGVFSKKAIDTMYVLSSEGEER